jgi:hypothetical protein
MDIRFYFDDDTGLPHFYAHGIDETEVEDVVNRPLENLPGRDGSRIFIGLTPAGRPLKVVVVVDEDRSGVFV